MHKKKLILALRSRIVFALKPTIDFEQITTGEMLELMDELAMHLTRREGDFPSPDSHEEILNARLNDGKGSIEWEVAKSQILYELS